MDKLNLIKFKGESIDQLCNRIAAFTDNLNDISISVENSKMGAIRSISLPPVITCRKNAPCIKDCYAIKHIYTLHPQSMNAYNRNLYILRNNPKLFYVTLEREFITNRFFRLHVSGDFYSYEYFDRVCELVAQNPHCIVLVFTKQYEIVNKWMDNHGGKKPENFQIVFSAWDGLIMDNPYNFPVAHVVEPNEQIPVDWFFCGGNCADCAFRGLGCWQLKPGENVAFEKR